MKVKTIRYYARRYGAEASVAAWMLLGIALGVIAAGLIGAVLIMPAMLVAQTGSYWFLGLYGFHVAFAMAWAVVAGGTR
jgi:hypothetical protein